MLPAGSYLVWEGGLYGDLYRVIPEGLARRHTPRRMPAMID